MQLPQIVALGTRRHTGRQQQHRLGLGICGGGRRHRIRQAGPAGRDNNAGASADSGIGFGRITGTLLVARRDRADTISVEVPVQLQVVSAGNTEDGVYTMCGKGFDDGGPAVAMVGHEPAASTDISS